MTKQIDMDKDIKFQNGFLLVLSYLKGDQIIEKKFKNKNSFLMLATNKKQDRAYFLPVTKRDLDSEQIQVDLDKLDFIGKIRSIHWQKNDDKKIFVHDFKKPGSLYVNKKKSIFCVTANRKLWTLKNGFN